MALLLDCSRHRRKINYYFLIILLLFILIITIVNGLQVVSADYNTDDDSSVINNYLKNKNNNNNNISWEQQKQYGHNVFIVSKDDNDTPSSSETTRSMKDILDDDDDMIMPDDDDNKEFCKGMYMTMFMDGLHWTILFTKPPSLQCLNYFVNTWKLENYNKFTGAMLFSFLLAVLVEGILSFRIRIIRNIQNKTNKHAFLTLIYGIQALLGYILMIITMSFSIELIISVIFGLMVGNGLFIRYSNNEDYEFNDNNNGQQLRRRRVSERGDFYTTNNGNNNNDQTIARTNNNESSPLLNPANELRRRA